MKSISREGDRIVIRLESGEAAFLATLPRRLADALRARVNPRLGADPQTDAELHQLLDAELAARRAERQQHFIAALGQIAPEGGVLSLADAEAEQWLAMLTDLRLALASRLGIQDDDWGHDLDPRHPPSQDHFLYFYLTHLQAGLLAKGFGVE